MESSKIPSVTTLGIRRGFYFPTHLKSPAFQFYATDYLGSQRVQMLTLEEEGAYIRLLCFCWQHGSIPASPKEMARLVGKGASTTICTTLQPMFIKHPTEPGRLVHERLEEERSKQADWKERSIKGGQSSAARRVGDSDWGKKMAQLRRTSNEPATNQTVRKTNEPTTNSPTPSPSPSPKRVRTQSEFKKPTMPEMELHATKIGLAPTEINKFFNYHESKGWVVGRTPMVSWRAAMVTWRENVNIFTPKSKISGGNF